MKKTSRKSTTRPRAIVGEMSTEYDFRGGVRGKYSEQFAKGAIVVTLDPDVAKAFPTSDDVNHALRTLLTALPARTRRRSSL